VFWTRGPGIVLIVIAAGLLLFGIYVLAGGLNPPKAHFDVAVTNCDATRGELPMATVGLSITNKTSTTRSAVVHIEYRDADGSRLDTDTSRVSSIAPGDTARTQESTLLDAAPSTSMTCLITGIN
jgi:hypothetical protein